MEKLAECRNGPKGADATKAEGLSHGRLFLTGGRYGAWNFIFPLWSVGVKKLRRPSKGRERSGADTEAAAPKGPSYSGEPFRVAMAFRERSTRRYFGSIPGCLAGSSWLEPRRTKILSHPSNGSISLPFWIQQPRRIGVYLK